MPVSRLLTDIWIMLLSQKYIFSGAVGQVLFIDLLNCLLKETAGILASFLLQKYQIYEFVFRCCSVVRWETFTVFLKKENGSANIQYNFYQIFSFVLVMKIFRINFRIVLCL
jgi:hypothetical protein